jgi:pimeloyl-ACP methyl ester carboxylesterase
MHIFSNNGFVFFGSCLLSRPEISGKISAIILDSAPSYITPTSGATALLAAVRRVEADKAAAGIRWNFLRTAMVPVMALMAQILKRQRPSRMSILNNARAMNFQNLCQDGRQSAAWGAWSRYCPRAPHLFIFSERDKMVPPHDIQAFAHEHAQRVRALGCPVQVDKWETGVCVSIYLSIYLSISRLVDLSIYLSTCKLMEIE